MFDGAKAFGIVAIVTILGATLAARSGGCWAFLGAAVGLYFLLSFYNSLERRDINDAAAKRKPKPKRKD